MRAIRFSQAMNEALHEEMQRDESVFIQGIGVKYAPPGGHAGGLLEAFGEARVRGVVMDEPVIAGSCVGAALAGMRPIADFSLADFATCALDEIFGKAGKWRYMHGGNSDMTLPIVFIEMIGGYTSGAAEHSQSPTALYLHSPGPKIAVPTTPYDAKGLLKTAIRDNNPVVFFIHKKLMGLEGEVPEEEYLLPFGKAQVLRPGVDVTVVATSYMASLAQSAADNLVKQGIDVEVIDPRTLEPLDIDSILVSVRKTGRLVVVDEDVERCGIGAEIGIQVMESEFKSLKGPVRRVGNPNLPVPYSPILEKTVLPSIESIESVVCELVAESH